MSKLNIVRKIYACEMCIQVQLAQQNPATITKTRGFPHSSLITVVYI